MKWLQWLPLTIIVFILILFMVLSVGGCSLFQMSDADKIASLPTTGPEAMFQTLKKANWLFTIAALGFGAGFFAFLNGSNKGLQFMAACFVVISLIIGVTRYSAVIAVISLIGTVCLMVYSVLVKRKALREVVQGVQDVRGNPSLKILEEDHFKSIMNTVQSKTTKAIVKTIKSTL